MTVAWFSAGCVSRRLGVHNDSFGSVKYTPPFNTGVRRLFGILISCSYVAMGLQA